MEEELNFARGTKEEVNSEGEGVFFAKGFSVLINKHAAVNIRVHSNTQCSVVFDDFTTKNL